MEWGSRQISVQQEDHYLNMDFDSLIIEQN